MSTSTPDATAIQAATEQLASLAPAFGERFAAAQRLLIRGGWSDDGGAVHFTDGATATARQCSCQEGHGPVVCLHRVAARILLVAAESRTPLTAACADCGSDLTPTTVARIGRNNLNICRPCHYARIAAGRQRQIALDLRLVERVLGGQKEERVCWTH